MLEGDSHKIKSIVDQIDDLPTLPSVVTRVMSMVEDPETSADDIGSVIRRDPSLTAKVLKIVNSPFYGYSRRISTVTEAVVILGLNSIKNLVLSTSVFEVFQGEGSYRFDRVGLWKHSIATGITAEMVSDKVDYSNSEEVMAAGILHAIGKIILDMYCEDELNRILDYARDHQCTMLEGERNIIEVDHPRIGAWLAERWNLPTQLTHAIRYYSEPMEAPQDERTLPCLIHVGNVIVRTKEIGWTGSWGEPDFNQAVWDELELTEQDVGSVFDKLESKMKEAEVFLNMSVKKAS